MGSEGMHGLGMEVEAHGEAKSEEAGPDVVQDAVQEVVQDVVQEVVPDYMPLPDAGSLGEAGGFRMPYGVVQEMMQMQFGDQVCADESSEFPTPYIPRSKNKYTGGLQDKYSQTMTKADRVEIEMDRAVCQCLYVPGMKGTACGPHCDCMLRQLYTECDDRCPCKSHCLNRRLQQRAWSKCSIFKTVNGRGWALRNDEALVPEQLVMEYIGEVVDVQMWALRNDEAVVSEQLVMEYVGQVVDVQEVNNRMVEYGGKRHTYMLKLNAEEYIDSTRQGCLARFINHCCEPNCVMQRWIVGRRQVVALFAKYAIPKGSELTFDYDMEFSGAEGAGPEGGGGLASLSDHTVVELTFDYDMEFSGAEGYELTFGYDMEFSGAENVTCLCGAPKCRGSLGKPKPEDPAPPPSHGKSSAAKASAKPPVGGSSKPAAKSSTASGKASGKSPAGKAGGAAVVKIGVVGGGGREEVAGGGADGVDEFFASLSPVERKRQMLALARIEKKH
ncbi:hypothetical protein T484DRAFT_1893097 [Baffinella frigidus]|nr:hypothetical protein T484DRAFT_1893097 [Cryptophyta sp. CCMP2293]